MTVSADVHDHKFRNVVYCRVALFEPFQPGARDSRRSIRTPASPAAQRARMRCTPARIVSPMDMPGRYTDSRSSCGSGRPSLAARPRRIFRTISWIRRDSAVSASGNRPTSSRRRRRSNTASVNPLAGQPGSRHGPHYAPHAVFGDLRSAHSRRQVGIRLASTTDSWPNPSIWTLRIDLLIATRIRPHARD